MSQTQRVTGVATNVFTDTEGALSCIYHQTVVAKRAKDGTITLNTGGWRTNTTKTRMNQFANQHCAGRFHVYQEAGNWLVCLTDAMGKTTTDALRFDGDSISFNI